MENAVKAAAAAPPPPPGGGEQEAGDGTVQCSQHRFKNSSSSNPGGICAFCLQEKLGKLVSSSFPSQPIIPSSSSSPSPSFRSDINGVYGGFCNSAVASSSSSSAGKRAEAQFSGQRSRSRSRMIPFVSAAAKKKKKSPSDVPSSFKRSKSTTSGPRRGPLLSAHQVVEDSSPRSRRVGFWSSIFYLSSSSKAGDSGKTERGTRGLTITHAATGEEDDAVSQRKVSRSRSVGCGSRSFSGDFFERISNGFGDCTLRRVESQREGNGKTSRSEGRRQREARNQKQEPIKERVRCGGIFGGFMLTTSSSSSSSSSSYWVCDEINGGANGNSNCGRSGGGAGANVRIRGSSSSWGWAFASPMRAFSRPSSKAGEKINRMKKNSTTAPNLNAIPSILSGS
ncbi:uncharacterized protein DDB_G0271670-like isoform X3 [Punica granatum]|uniref:Uncharacterized protein DDB_G0271670-like isoform X3 n=1 Tax=Punica granatum TaxID=22663 RepID=A0A6P8CG27_PUNGR|nr:uncharacterized protein DDB_G0271670-like isoform X3 [Punica granatum]